jgi:hypothetical protein
MLKQAPTGLNLASGGTDTSRMQCERVAAGGRVWDEDDDELVA